VDDRLSGVFRRPEPGSGRRVSMNRVGFLACIVVTSVLGSMGAGCSRSGVRIDPELLRVHRRSAHFILTTDVNGGEETLAQAEEAYELFSELLGIRPPRANLVVLCDRECFSAAFPSLGAGADGFYAAEPEPMIVTFPQGSPRVVRHELAHHFVRELVGGVPDWMNEGIAEILEGTARVEGVARLSLVVPDHLEHALEGHLEPPRAGSGAALHHHVDYPTAWATVAVLLDGGSGTPAERLLRLKDHAVVDPTRLVPAAGRLLELAKSRVGELARALRDGQDLWQRLPAARLLGRLGEASTLRGSWRPREDPVILLAAVAGSLARCGDLSALRELRPRIGCGHVLSQVALSWGIRLDSFEELDRWLKNP
jgi:hypothetical protein